MWAIIEIENLTSKEIESYKIVGSTESDIMGEIPMISNESPVWQALLWQKKWDVVTVKAPSWNFKYKIVNIK
jgi:transcription elongation GreA/GreB family factor